ncbi:hypothetical protein P3S68_031849 [Capsicum galapagoense]
MQKVIYFLKCLIKMLDKATLTLFVFFIFLAGLLVPTRMATTVIGRDWDHPEKGIVDPGDKSPRGPGNR